MNILISPHVNQPYTVTTADIILAPEQNKVIPGTTFGEELVWQRTCYIF